MISKIFGTAALAGLALALGLQSPALAQSSAIQQLVKDSHLTKVTQSGTLRVCQYTEYYSLSFRNPKTKELEGYDADMAKELAKDMGVKLQIVESTFTTFAADLQTDKCDIGMFGLAATMARGKAVEFSKPYILGTFYGVTRKGGKVTSWDDMDKDGNIITMIAGTFVEVFMKQELKHAKVLSITPPGSPEAELAANHADAMLTDYPTALKVAASYDWAVDFPPTVFVPKIQYTYAVAPGDQMWLNYVNLFVDSVKFDGRAKTIATKYKLESILAP